MRLLLTIVMLSLIIGCVSLRPGQGGIASGGGRDDLAVEAEHELVGIASWYGKDFHGRRMADGGTYDMYAMVAAHKTLPLGTRVKVVNLSNRKSVVVTIRDRGPYIEGRIIDLSNRAAKLLGMREKGVTKVRLQIIR